MINQEMSEQNPLKILHKSLENGLGKGKLGVVMAPAGVGKTACLIQIGLSDLLDDKDIFHVAIGQSVEQVNAWYDALFDDVASRVQIADREALHSKISRRRVIKIFSEGGFDAARLGEALDLFSKHMNLTPKTILVDGFGWGETSAQIVPELKALAAKLDAMSPLKVLGRGYAMAQNESGQILKSYRDVEAGERLTVTLGEGGFTCRVEEPLKEEHK